MIDINELRQSAQAATPGPWYIGSGTYEGRNIYSVEAVTDDEGFTYNPVVATAEDDDVVCWEANARLIAAANPAVISELLDRLEAAEKDAAELEARCATLADALRSTAQTLSWMQHGKCRGFSDDLLTTNEALEKARAALEESK